MRKRERERERERERGAKGISDGRDWRTRRTRKERKRDGDDGDEGEDEGRGEVARRRGDKINYFVKQQAVLC